VFGSPGTVISATVPTGSVAGDLQLACLGIENVAAGSGPWMTATNQGWQRAWFQGPVGGNGAGHEVWVSWYGSGTTMDFTVSPSSNWVFRGAGWINAAPAATEQSVTGLNIRDLVRPLSQGQTGSNPSSPTLYSYVDELVVALGSGTLTTPGWGTPAGWTTVFDNARAAAFGNVEIKLQYVDIVTEGNQVSNWTATASPAGARSTTGICAIRPPDRRIPTRLVEPGMI